MLELTNRLRNNNYRFRRVAAMAIFLFLAYLHQERLSQAAESTSKPIMTCVPNRPIANPGETIAVRVWINDSPDTATGKITWKASVGTIKTNKGSTNATWSFPKEDTSVSTEAPTTAQGFVSHKSLGKVECQFGVYFVPAPVIIRGLKKPPTLSGKTFLVDGQKEPVGYGLYTYILFGAPPRNDTERERYLKALESYLLVIRPIEEMEHYRSQERLNITLIPLREEPVVVEGNLTGPEQARQLAIKLLGVYDYTRAQVILADFGVSGIASGPFLASRRVLAKGSNAFQLRQDISHVSPNLVGDWTETFFMLATQESSWTTQTLQKLRLNMLNVIAVAAKNTPLILTALNEWITVL